MLTDKSACPVLAPCADYEPARLRDALLRALEPLGGLDWVRPGMTVGIKLNLCAGRKPEAAATTHPAAAAELTRLLTERGARVILGDSPGEPYTPAVLNRIYHTTGLSLCEEAGGILNRDFDYEEVSFPEGRSARRFMCCTWLRRCDAVINFSKLKAHGLMGMTAAVKNLYGIIPGTYKSEYHYLHPQPMDFADMLVDLNEYLRPALCLVDAVDIMEGNGPTQGTPRHLGLLLAGRSPYELDRLGARLLGLNEEEIPYMTAAERRGLFASRPEDYDGLAAPYRLTDFVRSGATTGWFAIGEDDPRLRKLIKKTLFLLLRSRPAPDAGCTGCGHCARGCPAQAIEIRGGRAVIRRSRCVYCFCCQEFCPTGAMKARRPLIARLVMK